MFPLKNLRQMRDDESTCFDLIREIKLHEEVLILLQNEIGKRHIYEGDDVSQIHKSCRSAFNFLPPSLFNLEDRQKKNFPFGKLSF